MELSKISTVVRPRSSWQAIDLGFKMASHWFIPLLSGWLMVALPIFLLLNLLLIDMPWLPPLIFWWLKPLWERAPLAYLSLAQFGQHSTLIQQFRSCRAIVLRQALATLTWRRFTFNRSYTAPIVQLENLAGARRRKRLTVFEGENQQAAMWLTIVGAHMETFIAIAIYFLLLFLLPVTSASNLLTLLQNSDFSFANNLVLFIVIALVTPFYVAAGFSLYLNQRTKLEGWDIEIAFRRLVAHQQQKRRGPATILTAIVLLIASTTLTWHSSEAVAAPSAEPLPAEPAPEVLAAKAQIQQIIDGEMFNHQTTQKYPAFFLDLKADEEQQQQVTLSPWLAALALFFANSAELLLTTIVIVLAILLLYYYRHWLAQFLPQRNNSKTAASTHSSRVFGIDIDVHSMSDDPLGQAQYLWLQGQKRQSLSLLYRASLYQLVKQQHLTVHDSYTEGECVLQIKRNASPATAEYFQQITRNWQRLAYAGITPDEATMTVLFEQWTSIFAKQADAL